MELEKYYYFLDDTEMGIAFCVLYYILCDKEISTWGLGGGGGVLSPQRSIVRNTVGNSVLFSPLQNHENLSVSYGFFLACVGYLGFRIVSR
jgi:hypothetical protein